MTKDRRFYLNLFGGLALILFAMAVWLVGKVKAADLDVMAFRYDQPVFGEYSDSYRRKRHHDLVQVKRWTEMCAGAGRYQAMSEAYELRKPNPCDGSKEWRR